MFKGQSPNSQPPISASESKDDENLNLPTDLGKGKTNCTSHPISNFVFFSGPSTNFREFALFLSCVYF